MPALQLPDGSGVVSQCRSPSLSLIQPQRPSSKEQLRYPESEGSKTHYSVSGVSGGCRHMQKRQQSVKLHRSPAAHLQHYCKQEERRGTLK